MSLIFVYGTLKHGGRLNPILSNDKFLGHVITSAHDFNLIGGSSFPFMVRKEYGFRVKGDLYEVSETTLKRLDQVEGYTGDPESSFYTRESILVDVGDGVQEEAFTYICQEAEENNNSAGITYNYVDNSKEWTQP